MSKAVGDMGENLGSVTTTEDAREVIENIALSKGAVTDALRRKAKEEAKNGCKDVQRAVEGLNELRKNLLRTMKV